MSAAGVIGDTDAVEGSGPSSPQAGAKDAASSAQTTDGWFYLLEGQHLGPLTTEELIGTCSLSNEVHML